jgi:RND family efflux transporter MFP subunit
MTALKIRCEGTLDRRTTMQMNKTLALMVVAAVWAVGCDSKPAKPKLGEVERLPRVETLKPEAGHRKITFETLATVEPLERARLSAQVQGEVKGLTPDIDIGKPIKKGEVLITLDIPSALAEQENKKAFLAQARNVRDQAEESRKVAVRDVEEAEAQVGRWKADLAFRELQLARNTELVRKLTVQPILQEESELQRNTAKAALGAAQAGVNTKKAKLSAATVELRVAESRIQVAQTDVKLAETKVEFAKIRAPFDGVITRRWVDNGAIIKDPMQTLLTVMRTDKVRVLIDIPEKYVPMIRATEGETPKGEANRVALTIGHYELEQRITRLAAAIDPQTRQMRAEIHVANPDNLKLRPGMTGTATVILDEGRTPQLNIPSTALVRVGDEIRVYYVEKLNEEDPPRGTVSMHVVQIGLDDGKTVEIRSGLTGKELIIAKGNGVVRQGEIVRAVPAQPLRTYQ